MAEMDWARTAPRQVEEATIASNLPKIIDWEGFITLVLMLGAVTAVAAPLEDGGWRRDMPPLTVVAVLAVLTSTALSRTRWHELLAWPLAIVAGAGVVAWQTLVMAGPGTLSQRIDAVYYRFEAWFDVAFSDQVTNDALPFNVLILALTWLGVYLFAWSVTRWHNAWIGLVPGGVALFLDLILVGDDLTGAIVLYMLFGFLLVMQTNLLANIERWRRQGANYPAMINLTFLHFSAWALVALLSFSFVVPAGPFSTPAPVQTAIDGVLRVGTDFVRLAGPLHSNKVIPIHSYSGVLPFQGSITLGDRELMEVTINDPTIQGPLLLRGTVYDQYEGGGWTTGERRDLAFPPGVEEAVKEAVANEELDGMVVPLRIEMAAKSVVGTVIFTPGEPIAASRELQAEIPAGAVTNISLDLGVTSGAFMEDDEVLSQMPEGVIGLRVVRDPVFGRVRYVESVRLDQFGALDEAVELDPGSRVKRHQSYFVSGFVPNTTPEELRLAGQNYPHWIQEQYLQLPGDFSPRVADLSIQVTAGASNPYDVAKAIETYLRTYPVDTRIGDVPAGEDAVDWFLFEERKGYFDYHASAMVVMLRMQGIPARLAVGFVADAGEQNDTGAYVVRDEDSYAWPEVYFMGHGWVPFNPTPDRDAVIAPQERPEGAVGSGPFADDLEGLFDRLPVSGADQAFFPEDGSIGSGGTPGGSIFGTGEAGYTPWALITALSFAGLVGGAVFFGWQRSVAGIPYPQQVWEKTVRLASWGGLAPEPGQTPHEYAGRLGKRFRDVSGWQALADAYTRSRFGRKETGEDEAVVLREMWPDARGAMLRGIAGRFLRRGRK